MTVSDAIYGASGRYVSRQRLETMLGYEYRKLTEHLASKRGGDTRFFVFADTVAAKSYTRKDNWHGWMGMRFQTRPGSEPAQLILHVSLVVQAIAIDRFRSPTTGGRSSRVRSNGPGSSENAASCRST